MSDESSHFAQIHNNINRAVTDYNLIDPGDRILVAVSGGKDSLSLLFFLKRFQQEEAIDFDLHAAHITTDFHYGGCAQNKMLTDFFDSVSVPYQFRHVSVLDEKKHATCFWCSWNKRKALFELADELKCNKIAFGHHKNDIVETILLNMFYTGEIAAMRPHQILFDGRITIIRPLCYVEEESIKQYAQERQFPSQMCKCPFGSTSRRKHMKDVIHKLEKISPQKDIKSNIFNSILNIA